MNEPSPQPAAATTPQPPPASGTAARLQTFVSDVAALGGLQILQRLPGLALLPVISQSLGATGWGIWSLFFVAGEALGIMCDVALDDALVRFVAGSSDREDQREYFYSLIASVAGLSLPVAIGLWLWSGAVARLIFGSAEYVPFVRLLCLYLISESFDNLALNMLRALLHVKTFVALEATQIIARTLLVVLVLLSGQGLWWGMVVYMGVQWVWLATEFVVVYSQVGFRFPNFKYLKACLAYSLPLVPTRYSNVILTYSDRLIIASYLGPAAAGIYAASYDLALLIWQLVNPVRVALYPILSRLWDSGLQAEAGQYLTRSTKVILFLAIPSAAGLSILAPHILALMSTADFVRVSYYIVPLAAVGVIFQALSLIFGILLRLHKDTRAVAAGLVTSAAVHLAFNFILIPAIGVAGGAIASVIGYVLDLAILSTLAWRTTRFPLPVRPALVFAAATVVMAPAVWWLSQGGGWAPILGAVLAGALIYGAAVLLLRGITVREIRILLNRSGV